MMASTMAASVIAHHSQPMRVGTVGTVGTEVGTSKPAPHGRFRRLFRLSDFFSRNTMCIWKIFFCWGESRIFFSRAYRDIDFESEQSEQVYKSRFPWAFPCSDSRSD